jgi:hypothetical protein
MRSIVHDKNVGHEKKQVVGERDSVCWIMVGHVRLASSNSLRRAGSPEAVRPNIIHERAPASHANVSG